MIKSKIFFAVWNPLFHYYLFLLEHGSFNPNKKCLFYQASLTLNPYYHQSTSVICPTKKEIKEGKKRHSHRVLSLSIRSLQYALCKHYVNWLSYTNDTLSSVLAMPYSSSSSICNTLLQHCIRFIDGINLLLFVNPLNTAQFWYIMDTIPRDVLARSSG